MSELDSSTEKRLQETARTAWALGLVAIILAVLSSCSSGMTLFGALPLGILATMRAREVLAAPERDAVSEVYAKTGNITGLTALIFSIVWLTFLGSIVLLYVGMFAMIFTQI